MPLYEYQCPSCNHKFEKLLPMSQADEPLSCPNCHNGAQRVLSLFASFSTGGDGIPAPVAGAGVG